MPRLCSANDNFRELKYDRFWDAEGRRKLRVLFPGTFYCSVQFKMLKQVGGGVGESLSP